MMEELEYKGYFGSRNIDDEGRLYGHIMGLSEMVRYFAGNDDELEEQFHEAVDTYLQACKDLGKEPEKPDLG